MHTIYPKTLGNPDPASGPLFFLAGPVGGEDDWQTACCLEIQKHIRNFQVAIPWPYKKPHLLMDRELPGTADHFERQLNWERHYLELASRSGCIIFWLPEESRKNPRTGSGSYAMDTRGELGEWRGRLMHDNSIRIVVGAEPGFPGLDVLKRSFSLALDIEFPIYSSLADTAAAAVAWSRLSV